ncbi:MAG: ubiquinone biosynthesis protein [Aliidongia sp.]|nr:ubiquinone biosynthesis protein [Aliidongia sp.]
MLTASNPALGVCIMSILAEESPHVRPLVAWRALRTLLRNGEDTKQVFIIGEALRGRSGMRCFERFRRTEVGRSVLAGERSLLSVLGDRAALAALPQATLGHRYHDFMAEENLSADGLIDAFNAAGTSPLSDPLRRFRERSRDQHDLQHVVTGYGRDGLGEICLLAFAYAQTGNRGLGAIALAGTFKVARALRGQPVFTAVVQAYRHGRAAAVLIEQDWEALLSQPLRNVRRNLGIEEPTLYRRILKGVGRDKAAAQDTRPDALAAEF